MFYYQQKPEANQKKSNHDSQESENLYQNPVFNYWLEYGKEILKPSSGYSKQGTISIQKKEIEEEQEESIINRKTSKTENAENLPLFPMRPTVTPSVRQMKIAQMREQAEEIRQNKPMGMNTNTNLKLSDSQESSKMVARAKFTQFKKKQIKQLKRNKQASIQFQGKVKQFEQKMVQYNIDYGSENYNALVNQHFPNISQVQLNQTSNTITQKKETEIHSTEGVKTENKTGMPDQLKEGIEKLSAIDMGDVRVHYNSDKPNQMQANAFTQGADIHIAQGRKNI